MEQEQVCSLAKGAVRDEDVAIKSSDGSSTCRGHLWLPLEENPTAVVQVVHGMAEHIERYEDLACAFAAQGWATVGIDHVGHGRTTPNAEQRGTYDPASGATTMVEDQHRLRLWAQERLGGVPHVILGHSMGSFVTRCYIGAHGEGLAAAVIMGTGWQTPATLAAGRLVAGTIARFRGWDYRSPLVDSLGVGGYNRRFEGTGAKTGHEWLSRDEERCRAYAADPDCGFMFALSGYRALFDLVGAAQSARIVQGVPASLPVFVISGSDDPVGNFGEAPAKVFRALKAAGVEDVELDLVEGGRHEILGETCADEVMAELVEWIAPRVAANH